MESYQMQVKARCRKHFRKFIQKNLRALKKDLNSVTVLCFPGIDGLEVTDIYDRLGIPRKNITCLERDKDVYKKILHSKQTYGCNIINKSLADFLKTKTTPFDIISLDFMGHISSFTDDFQQICEKSWLKDKCIVFTNFAGAREQFSTKELYFQNSFIADNQNDIFESMIGDRPELSNRVIANLFKKIGDKDLKSNRDCGISTAILQAFGSRGNCNFWKKASDFFGTEERVKSIEGEITDIIAAGKNQKEGIDPKDLGGFIAYKSSSLVNSISAVELYQKLESLLEFVLTKLLDPIDFTIGCLKIDVDGYEYNFTSVNQLVGIILTALHCSEMDSAIVHDVSSYKYISSNGMPMFADALYLEYNSKSYSFLKDIFKNRKSDDFNGYMSEIFDHRSVDELLQLIMRMDKANRSRFRIKREPGERMFLGSETRVSGQEVHNKVHAFKDDASAKTRVIELLNSNPKIETDRLAFLTGAPFRKVSAWRAHHTMGTYKNLE